MATKPKDAKQPLVEEMAIDPPPQVTLSFTQKPKPTVTNVKLSIGEANPVVLNPGGDTCGATTHSYVISPKMRGVASSTH